MVSTQGAWGSWRTRLTCRLSCRGWLNELSYAIDPLQDWNRGLKGQLDTSAFEQLRYTARYMIIKTCAGILLPQQPISRITPIQRERNDELSCATNKAKRLLNWLTYSAYLRIVSGRQPMVGESDKTRDYVC